MAEIPELPCSTGRPAMWPAAAHAPGGRSRPRRGQGTVGVGLALAGLLLLFSATKAHAQPTELRSGSAESAPPAAPQFGSPGTRLVNHAVALRPTISVTLGEGADPQEARRFLERIQIRTDSVQGCHARALSGDPSLEGTLRLSLAIGPDGRPSQCTVLETPNAELGPCACSTLKRQRFPASPGGATRQVAVQVSLQRVIEQRVQVAPGCGEGVQGKLPPAILAIARRILDQWCLGPRSFITFEGGTLEIWADTEPRVAQAMVAAGGGHAAFRAAGIKRLRLRVTGGPAGEYEVIPPSVVTISPR